MAIDITSILSELETQVVSLAKTTVTNYENQAIVDGKQLLALMKDDLARWTQELIDGQISKDEFADLVIGDKDLATMTALTQAGLALVAVDQFRTSLFSLITDTVFNLVKV